MNDALEHLLFDTLRLDEAWHKEFARALTAAVDGTEDRLLAPIEHRYAADSHAVDAYSRVACYLMRQGKREKALEWFAMDAKSGRQTWWQRLRHAEGLAGSGRLPQALSLAGAVYDSTPEAVNGYAAIAWILREQGRMAEALEWMRKDIDEHRITPGFCLNAAVLFAEAGDFARASALVEDAYRRDASLCDGWVRLGRIRYQQSDLAGALELYRRDAAEDRITTKSRLPHADFLAHFGHWQDAADEIQLAYDEDPALRDRFVRLGNLHYRRRQFDDALRLYRRDSEVGRLTATARPLFADLLARAGQWQAAELEVHRAYEEDAGLKDGFARLGNLRRERGAYGAALALCECDAKAGRITAAFRPCLAELLARSGRWEEASAEIRHAYEEDASLRDAFAGLAKWVPTGTGHMPETDLCELDRQAGRQTSRGIEMCAAALRARASLEAELAAIDAWRPPELDIRRQWHTLDQLARMNRLPNGPVDILDAELFLASSSDALIQFRELVLQESYFFECDHSRPLIIDGGANIGMAMAYFKWLFPDARILAFEPHPDLFALCQRSIAHNKWRDVTIHPSALLDKTGSTAFHILNRMPMGSSVTQRLSGTLPAPDTREVSVPCVRLNDFITGPVTFLKLDIEGAETRVLRELGASLRRVRRGFIEYHYGAEDNSLGELLSILERHEFCYRLADPAAATAAMPLHGRRQNSCPPWSCSIYFHGRH